MKIARKGVPALLCAAALLLAGCTFDDGSSGGPSSSHSPHAGSTAKPTESAQPQSSLEAVVVVANVDVDGVNATASGYVGGVIEDGGECTFVFTGESHEVEAVSAGLADRATTSCGAVSVPVDQLGKGQWSVRLEYRSNDIHVVSEESIMEVP